MPAAKEFRLFSARLVREPSPDPILQIVGEAPVRGPADVAKIMWALTDDRPQEEFWVFTLNTRHRVVGATMVTRGILDASLIHPREVFRAALLDNAASIIIAHNHPSGDPTPSPEDRAVTRQLREAGKALGIPLLDHVVVGHRNWRSIANDPEFV
jgi:DNA repair protein RadC